MLNILVDVNELLVDVNELWTLLWTVLDKCPHSRYLSFWEYLHRIFDLTNSDQVQAAVPKDTLLIRDKNRLKQVNKCLITVDAAFK